ARFWDPDATSRGGLGGKTEVSGELEPMRWGERAEPIHAGGVLAAIVLGDPTNGETLGRPGSHQEPLERAYSLDLATPLGSVDARLELEDPPLELAPGEGLP